MPSPVRHVLDRRREALYLKLVRSRPDGHLSADLVDRIVDNFRSRWARMPFRETEDDDPRTPLNRLVDRGLLQRDGSGGYTVTALGRRDS